MKRPILSSQDNALESQQSSDQFTSIRKKVQLDNHPKVKKPDTKCLQNNLVYIINMPLWFQDENIVKKNIFFGRYGKVTSVITSIVDSAKTKIPNSKYIQTYITYQNEKDAALSIAAVNDIKYIFRVLRATYGTNRLCNMYLKGQKCKIRNCFYLHDEIKCMKIQGPLKTDFQKQKQMAYDIIKKNLSYFMQKIELQTQEGRDKKVVYQDKGQSFPSIKQVIDNLVEKGIISKSLYTNAVQQQLDLKKRMSQKVKKIQYIRYRTKSSLQVQTIQKQDNQIIKQVIQTKTIEIYPPKVTQIYEEKDLQSCSFLMSNIIQVLNGQNQDDLLRKKKVYKPKQKVMKNSPNKWEKMNVFGQFFNEPNYWQDQMMDTQESSKASSSQNSPRIQSSPSFCEVQSQYQMGFDEANVLNRVRQQILKTKMVKLSKLQFTEDLSYNKKQYCRITQILKKQLIK